MATSTPAPNPNDPRFLFFSSLLGRAVVDAEGRALGRVADLVAATNEPYPPVESLLVRLDVEFGVAYSSDLHAVRDLAVAVAKGAKRVIASPTPVCHVTGFGDNAVNLLLHCHHAVFVASLLRCKPHVAR